MKRTMTCLLLILEGCVSCDGDDSQRRYLPCNGEPGACVLAGHMGGSDGDEGCLCTIFCTADSDCPVPDSGTAVPICRPFGDYVINGHTAACRLPCDSSTRCPDGMFCSGGDCWAAIGR